MTIIKLKGTDNDLYKYIGPFAMNKKVLDYFGYPIYTTEKREWLVVLENEVVLSFCSIEYTKPTINIGNLYYTDKSSRIKSLIKECIKIWNKSPQDKIRVYLNVNDKEVISLLGFEFKRGKETLVFEKEKK